MGGIKNKLIYEPPFRKRGVVPVALRVGVPLTSRRYDDSRYNNRISIGGFDRVLKLTKYTSIACLSLAILSTITLNIISSYSSSNIESNAESIVQSENGLADGPATVSLYIHDAIGSCTDTSNPANVCMEIPDDGGIATGGHTVTIAAYGVGWRLGFGSGTDSGLSNGDFSIPSIDSASAVTELPNNTWGYDGWSDGQEFAGYQKVSSTGLSQTIYYVYGGDRSSAKQYTNNIHIQYGVRVDRPGQMLAGNYSANVVYLLEPQLIPGPQIDSVTPADYTMGSGNATAVIQGDYLATTYDIYMERDGIKYSLKDSVTSVEMRRISFTIPANGIQPGGYTIHVVTQGGEATTQFEYKEKPVPVGSVCANADSSSACVVDMDANMIPIYYTGDDNSPEWTSLSDDDIQNTPSAWYNYGEKKWANAVTVKPEALTKYKNQHTKIDENDVLGYWVYIPRYAYEVMRRDAGDLVIMDTQAASEGGFQIKFETAETVKKQPQTSCSDPDNGKYIDYRTGCGISREYGSSTGTTWGTHPAFSWVTDYNSMGSQYKELNGFWVGKFETSGSMTNPMILPNQYHKTVYYVGEYYSLARKLGVDDPNNRYGNDTDASDNYHNLATNPSHMAKNSEWGAVTYLSSSVYGAGVNGVQPNTSADGDDGWGNYSGVDGDGNDTYGITGCGPSADGNTGDYDCSGDSSHQYQSKIGQLASTTGNVYGVYDMAGGADELVAAVRTNMYNQAPSFNITYAPTRPYVDLYEKSAGFGNKKPSWSWSSGAEAAWNNEVCTWETCGGHALVETTNRQVMYRNQGSWGNGDASFAYLEGNRGDLPWFERGLGAYEATIYSYSFSGGVDSVNHDVLAGNALRVVVADTL